MNTSPPGERESAANLNLESLLTEQEYARITKRSVASGCAATGFIEAWLPLREIRSTLSAIDPKT